MKRSALDAWAREKEGLERADRAAIEALQLKKMNATLSREHARGGFYAGLPEGLNTLAALSDLPFTTADDLVRHGGAMTLVSQGDVEKIVTSLSSGTTGPSKRLFYTAGDVARTVSFYACGLSELVRPGDRVLVMMPCAQRDSVGDLILRALKIVGAEGVPLGDGGTVLEIVEAARKADCVVAPPVPLLSAARVAAHEGAPIRLRAALVSADVCADAVVKGIETLCACRLWPHYGSRETLLGCAVTCPAHAGMHVRENDFICEIADEKGRACPDGTWGELVVTSIGAEAMPLVRLRTGDEAMKRAGDCPCGSHLMRIAVRGRLGSAMPALDEALFSDENVVDYRVFRTEEGYGIQCRFAGEAHAEIWTRLARRVLGAPVHVKAERYAAGMRPLYDKKRAVEGISGRDCDGFRI